MIHRKSSQQPIGYIGKNRESVCFSARCNLVRNGRFFSPRKEIQIFPSCFKTGAVGPDRQGRDCNPSPETQLSYSLVILNTHFHTNSACLRVCFKFDPFSLLRSASSLIPLATAYQLLLKQAKYVLVPLNLLVETKF